MAKKLISCGIAGNLLTRLGLFLGFSFFHSPKLYFSAKNFPSLLD